jgi:hypothetical protein
MIRNPVIRIVYSGLFLIGVFFMPWWLAFVVAGIGIILFPWYLEVVFVGLYFDVFFGYPALDWYRNSIHTLLLTVFLVVVQYLKPRINYVKF